jgi:peptidyl-prolyl cis-trans isomerase C
MVKALRVAVALCLVCTVGLLTACRKTAATNDNKSAAPSTASADLNKPVPETLPAVVARVNGENITKADFEQHISRLEMSAGQQVPKAQRNEIYRKALDRLIDLKVLRNEVKSRNLQVDEKIVDEQMQKIRGQFPSEEEYKKALSAKGMTPEQLRTELLDESRITKMMETEAGAGPAVSDADIRDFYEKNPDKFRQAESVRASHILIRVQPGDETARKKALATIQNLQRQAKAGKDFGDLARRFSNDSSAQGGGDLGFFTKDRMVPEFANAAFALKPGEISGVVQTSYGYHIIKLTERRPAATVPLEQVSGQVREYLTKQRQQEKAEAFVKGLRSKSKVEVLI